MRSLINFALNVFAIAVALWAVVTVIPGITITPAETGNFIAIAIVFIYLVLASQFGSFLQPIAIMASLPLALIGVMLALLLCALVDGDRPGVSRETLTAALWPDAGEGPQTRAVVHGHQGELGRTVVAEHGDAPPLGFRPQRGVHPIPADHRDPQPVGERTLGVEQIQDLAQVPRGAVQQIRTREMHDHAEHGVAALLDGPLHDREAGAWRSRRARRR